MLRCPATQAALAHSHQHTVQCVFSCAEHKTINKATQVFLKYSTKPRNSKALGYWATDIIQLVFLLSIFYLLWLGSYPLFTPDEGRYSEVAREMVASQDFITPRINGVAFLDKPVLYYWLQAAAISLFGVKEWAI